MTKSEPVFFVNSYMYPARFYLQKNFDVVIKFLKFKMLEARQEFYSSFHFPPFSVFKVIEYQ